jgi:hypothetical protein
LAEVSCVYLKVSGLPWLGLMTTLTRPFASSFMGNHRFNTIVEPVTSMFTLLYDHKGLLASGWSTNLLALLCSRRATKMLSRAKLVVGPIAHG